MILFPAIDLQNGQCVRLSRGDFKAATIYESDPIKQAQRFEQAGATWLHLVDLDGAQRETLGQLSLLEQITKQTKLKVQVGGGIRTLQHIESLFAAGVARLVIGSLAVKEPDTVKDWFKKFGGEKIVLAMDVGIDQTGTPEILTKGWQEGSGQSLWNVLDIYKKTELQTILCTDVARDGMLSGTNHSLYAKIKKFWPALNLIASGGVSDSDDLRILSEQGLYGAIIGKALYEGKIDLGEATKDFIQKENTACRTTK